MQSKNIRKKVINMIIDFEEFLKKSVAEKIRNKYHIELEDPKIKEIFKRLKKHKYLAMGFNIDLSVLSGIIKSDMSLFCDEACIF